MLSRYVPENQACPILRLRDCVRCAILPLCHPCRRRCDWLLLEDSMTQRFEQQGKQVTVTG